MFNIDEIILFNPQDTPQGLEESCFSFQTSHLLHQYNEQENQISGR